VVYCINTEKTPSVSDTLLRRMFYSPSYQFLQDMKTEYVTPVPFPWIYPMNRTIEKWVGYDANHFTTVQNKTTKLEQYFPLTMWTIVVVTLAAGFILELCLFLWSGSFFFGEQTEERLKNIWIYSSVILFFMSCISGSVRMFVCTGFQCGVGVYLYLWWITMDNIAQTKHWYRSVFLSLYGSQKPTAWKPFFVWSGSVLCLFFSFFCMIEAYSMCLVLVVFPFFVSFVPYCADFYKALLRKITKKEK
jgi:hypothetical protein